MALFFFLLLLYSVLFSRCFFLVGGFLGFVRRPSSVHLFRGALFWNLEYGSGIVRNLPAGWIRSSFHGVFDQI